MKKARCLIEEMTRQEIEDAYNECSEVLCQKQHTYKDLITIESLELEIDRRGYYWQGWELMEGDE